MRASHSYQIPSKTIISGNEGGLLLNLAEKSVVRRNRNKLDSRWIGVGRNAQALRLCQAECVRWPGEKAGCALDMCVEAFFRLEFLLLFFQEKSKSTGSEELAVA